MFPSKFLQFPSILTHFHAANEKIQNGGRDLAISRGLVWVNFVDLFKAFLKYPQKQATTVPVETMALDIAWTSAATVIPTESHKIFCQDSSEGCK